MVENYDRCDWYSKPLQKPVFPSEPRLIRGARALLTSQSDLDI